MISRFNMSGVVFNVPQIRLISISAKVGKIASKQSSNVSNSELSESENSQFSIKTIEISTGQSGPWSLLPKGEVWLMSFIYFSNLKIVLIFFIFLVIKIQAAQLFEQNIFNASVEPDLPSVAKLIEMFEPTKPKTATEPFSNSYYEESLDLSNFQIKTVAAQTKSLAEVSKLICERGNKEKTGALLLVSGGDTCFIIIKLISLTSF